MSYQAVYLLENGYREDTFRYVNSDRSGRLCPEIWDGSRVRVFEAAAVYLYRKEPFGTESSEVLSFTGTAVKCSVTDSRIMLSIPAYPETSLQESAACEVQRRISRKYPSERRELTPAGMLRYEWLARISYQRKISRGTEECVRLYYRDDDKTDWYLDLVLPKEGDACRIANRILHRACRYRLRMTDEKNDKELYFFTRYQENYEIEPTEDPKHSMSSIRFPSQYPAPGGAGLRPEADAGQI